jgi:hypothetical protein
MKKFALIVLVLIAILLAVAFVTKPSDVQLSLTHVLIGQLPMQEKTLVTATGGDTVVAKSVGSKVEFKDRIFWVDAKVGGKTVFTGAFGKWFPRIDEAYKLIVDVDNLKEKAINDIKKAIPPIPGPAGDKLKEGMQDLTNKVKIPGT